MNGFISKHNTLLFFGFTIVLSHMESKLTGSDILHSGKLKQSLESLQWNGMQSECQTFGLDTLDIRRFNDVIVNFKCKEIRKYRLKFSRQIRGMKMNSGLKQIFPNSLILFRKSGSQDHYLLLYKALSNATFLHHLIKQKLRVISAVKVKTLFQRIVFVQDGTKICKCFRFKYANGFRSREKRAISTQCIGASKISSIIIEFNADYKLLTAAEKSSILSKMASYTGITVENLQLSEHIGFTFIFYPAKLAGFGIGDSKLTVVNNTVVEYVVSCGEISSSDSRVVRLQNDASSGSLSQTIGQPVARWFLVVKDNYAISTTPMPTSTTTPSGPQPPRVTGPVSVYLSNTTFRTEFHIPPNTFIDKEDGNALSLELFLYNSNGGELPKSSWVDMHPGSPILKIFSSRAIVDNQPKSGYSFRLSAIDSSGRESHTELTVSFGTPFISTNYMRTLLISSSMSVIITSFFDVDILYVLQSRMSAHLSINASDIITNVFNVTRTSQSVSIHYEFSTRALAQSPCNTAAINYLRSKFSGTAAEESFKLALKPQFNVESLSGESFQYACSHLSTNRPVVGALIDTLNYQYDRVFSYAIPKTVFSSPSGSNMRLRLELRFQNNTVTPLDYWVTLSKRYLDEGAMLQGLVMRSYLPDLTSVKLRLVAQTPLLVESFQDFEISIQKGSISPSFKVLTILQSSSTTLMVTFVTSFVSFISSYLNVFHSFFMITNFTKTKSIVSLTWSISTLSVTPCQVAAIESVKKKLVNSDGSINETFRLSLINSINFTATSVQFTFLGDCDRPSVNATLPQLQIPKYGPLLYVVPNNVFHDGTDGSNLQLNLLEENGDKLHSTSWISFNKNTKTISGFPFDLGNKTFKYILRATDSNGFSIDQNVSIVLPWVQPTYKFFYQVRFIYNSQLLPVSNVITTFIQKIKTYFKQHSEANVIIFRPIFISGNRISLYYQNTSLSSVSCDVIGSSYIRSRLLDATENGKPNTDFVNSMKPEFIIEETKEEQTADCALAGRKPPYVNSANKTIREFFEMNNIVPYSGVMTYLIPANAFIDEEQGNTRNLNLNLTTETGLKLPVDNWVVLNASTQIIYVIARDDVFLQNAGLLHQYRLIAKDADGKSAEIPMKFSVAGQPPDGHYNVSMKLDVLPMQQQQPYTFQIEILLKNLKTIFGNAYPIQVRSYSVTETTAGRFVATFVWSPFGMTEHVCDVRKIAEVQSKLFKIGTKEMNSGIASVIDSRFQLMAATESFGGPCTLEPPFVYKRISTIDVTFCGPFTFKIPADSFKDNQDGDTTKLNLTLLMANSQPIPNDFWMQFDVQNQQIRAVLTEAQNGVGYQKEHSFVLVATDTTKLSVNTTLNVKITGKIATYSHSFTIQSLVNAQKPFHKLNRFVDKIQSFLSDKRPNFQAISSSEGSGNVLAVTWTNCSLRYDPCDTLSIKRIRERMQTISGTVKPEFTTWMQPEFTQLFFKESNFGPCKRDQPPSLVSAFGPINITTCGTFSTIIPENTFNDNEQGNTRNLELKLKANPYHWVYFNKTSQIITIVVTREIVNSLPTSSVQLDLVASDVFLQEAKQTIFINLESPVKAATQKVTLLYQIQGVTDDWNFPMVYQTMRANLIQYFSQIGTTSIEYISLPKAIKPSGEIVKAEWGSCSTSRDSCDANKLNSITALISSDGITNSTFKSALLPIFKIISANVSSEGICKEQILAPVVQNPLPVIDIGYCGYKFFKIPTNTFYHQLEGNTRNLTLDILGSNDQPFTATWLHFEKTQQALWVVLSDNDLSSVNIPSVLNYKLKATTKFGQSVTDKLRLRINEKLPNVSFSVKLNFAWQQRNPPNQNVILATVIDRMAAYMGGRPTDLHYSSISVSHADFGLYFVVNIANCTTRYDPCDTDFLQVIKNKIHDQYGTLDAFKAAMGSDIYITYVQLQLMGPCNKKNSPPYVKNQLTRVRVQACSDFNYTIPTSTFEDEEQAKLQLAVTKINGLPVSGSYKWVDIDTKTGTLHGIVTELVLKNMPAKGYNLTIRATDKGQLFAETHLIVEIIGTSPQKLYQFTMKMSPRATQTSKFTNELQAIRLLNGFFNARFANLIISFMSTSDITIRCSICTMPKKCDESLASSYFNRIVTSQNTVPTELASYFSSQYTILSTSIYRNPLCKVALHPPVPSKSTWKITGSYCGGFRTRVPADLFSDREDGNTRNLDLNLIVNEKDPISSSYWVQINKTSQEVYGFPTRATTLAYTNATQITLVATDTTGQEGSVRLEFSFTAFPEPQFIFKLAYQTSSSHGTIDEIISLSSKIKVFLNDQTSSSFGLIQNLESPNGLRYLDFANCSVSYNPCDIYALSKIKDRILTVNNLPTNAFKAAMNPFVINYGTVKLSGPCAGASTHPPMVVNRITLLNISVWSIFTYHIPANTFYDTEDGNTRRLTILLTDGNNQAVNVNSWLQLNTSTQTISAFAYASIALAQPSSGYQYMLTATDSTKLSATNAFFVKIYGPVQILKDCQIQMRFTANAGLSSRSNNDLATIVFKAIQRFFSLNSNDIGLVDFIRHTSTQFTISWSYVSPIYRLRSMTSNNQYTSVDYKGLIVKVLQVMFEEDRKTLKTSLYSAFQSLLVVSARTVFSGVCKNIPPVSPAITNLQLNVNYCGYQKEAIEPSWFYDFEDGNAFNLKLELLNGSNSSLGIESWINFDIVKRTLLMSLRELQRSSSNDNFQFYLKATDSGGKTAVLPITVRKADAVSTISPFKIFFEFTISTAVTQDIYVNQSIAISDVTAQFFGLSSGKSIITNQYNSQSGMTPSRSFSWLPCSYQPCSSSALQKTREILKRNNGHFETLRAKYLPNYFLQRVYYLSACGNPGLRPAPSPTAIILNITLCSIFSYKIPETTFIDSEDGEVSNMRIRLLSGNKQELPADSWIGLNTATLQLHALYQSSMLPTVTKSQMTYYETTSTSPSSMASPLTPMVASESDFYLEATNSRGLTALKQIKVNILDYPYTSDCYMTVLVSRQFGPNHISDLEVLQRLISAISGFYQDKASNIKVYKFKRLRTDTYSLTYSNCTFTFSSMSTAKWGLDESYRSAITAIFSRIIRSDGSAQRSFASALLSAGFEIQNIHGSYSCIEKPPLAKVTEIKRYAFICMQFNDPLAPDLFNDTRDGTNLALSLRYTNGSIVLPNEWLQLNSKTRTVYGSVTGMQKKSSSSMDRYDYLLFATDSSGRSANVSYIVYIANSAPNQNVSFVLGFDSTFNEFTKSSVLFSNITRRLAKYIDGNDQGRNIVIHSYHASNVISWGYCSLSCDENAIMTLLRKLQKVPFKPLPSEFFKASMGPSLIPQYIFASGLNCMTQTNVQIISKFTVNINGSMCGYMDYVIPSNVFSSSDGDSTRDFLLSIRLTSGEKLSTSSLIQFRQDLQRIQGLSVLSKIRQMHTYTLDARSSKSASASAKTTVKINYPDFQLFNSVTQRLCSISINVTTLYNPEITDVNILRKFIDKLAKYLGGASQQIQILSYTRHSNFPIKLMISFSNCSWAYMLQTTATSSAYFTSVGNTLQNLFQSSGTTTENAKKELIAALKPDFQLQSIESNKTTCIEPPNKPPFVKESLTVTAPRCGEFNYKLPADLFSDEDGDTRTLKIQLLQKDGALLPSDSWIVYDNKTQIVSGLPFNWTLANQPKEGYQYRILATDTRGLSTFAILTIKVDGSPYNNSDGVALNVYFRTTINSKYQMNVILAFTRKLSTYKTINDPYNRFRIKASTIQPTSAVFSLLNCTPCNPEAAIKYYEMSNQKTELERHMAPEFPSSFYVKSDGNCGPGSDGYNNVSSGIVHNVSFCGMTRMDFLNLTGIIQLPLDTKFVVRQENKQALAQDSWFWFNETSSTLEAFASEETWKKQPQRGQPYLWSIGKILNNERIGSFVQNRLLITGTPPSSGLQYTLDFTTQISGYNVDAYYISIVFNALATYFKRGDLQHVSFTRQSDTNLRFTWKFMICGLPRDCTKTSVKILNDKIFKYPGQLREEFLAIFPKQINVNSMTGNCDDYPPEILKKSLNITIPVCGLYRYKIPNDFARDQEDGDADSLFISMRTSGNNMIPRDSWIQFNETSHEIYAFPTESISRTQQESGWKFLLLVKDKGGKEVKTTLTVFVSRDETAFYKLSFTFRTVNQDSSTKFLNIQIQFLSIISKFYFNSSLSQYRVLNFERTATLGPKSEVYFLQIGNCTVTRRLCNKIADELTVQQRKLVSDSTNTNSQFYRYISNFFVISSMRNESLYSIDRPPIVLNQMNVIRVNMCSEFKSEIPKATFYDDEPNSFENLRIVLTLTNGSRLSSDHWVQLISNKLYVVPYGDLKSGTYNYKLTAEDQCGQSVSTPLTVNLKNNVLGQATYGFAMKTSLYNNNLNLISGAYYISKLRNALTNNYPNRINQTKVTFYKRVLNEVNTEWAFCIATCNKSRVLEFIGNLFRNHSSFLPYFDVTNVTIVDSKNCSTPIRNAPIANRSLSLNVSFCRSLNFQIPVNTFNDPEDGGTRMLTLKMLTESKAALSKQSWVQFDERNQTIYGYPRVNESGAVARMSKYWLTARDRDDNAGWTPLSIEINDTLSMITYKLTITGETRMSATESFVAQETFLIQRIGAFFDDYAINSISFNRDRNRIRFSWSFCKMATDKCDCYKIQEVRNKLQQFEDFKKSLEPEFVLQDGVIEEMLGVCERTQKPVLNEDQNELVVRPGQYFNSYVRDDKFYDYEDGFTKNLTVYLANRHGTRVESSNWIRMEDYKICGLLTLVEANRMKNMQSRSMVYKTIARDRCRNATADSFDVKLLHVTQLDYKVTVFLNDSFGNNCSKIADFTKKISSYVNFTEAEIYIYNYTVYNVTQNASMVVWGVQNITDRNCTNGTVNEIRTRLLLANNSVHPLFNEFMRPEFEVVDVKDEATDFCAIPIIILPPPASETDFPWWIIILILVIILLLLLLWILWVCIPRCCWKCCGQNLICCRTCCTPGGKYASLGDPLIDEKGILAKPSTEDTKDSNSNFYDENDPKPDGIGNEGYDNDPEDDQIPLTDPDYMGDKLPILGNDEPEDTGPEEDSSGFREEFSDGSADPVVTDEIQMQEDILPFVESAPIGLPESPRDSPLHLPVKSLELPANVVPPMYSFATIQRPTLDDLFLTPESSIKDDTFADNGPFFLSPSMDNWKEEPMPSKNNDPQDTTENFNYNENFVDSPKNYLSEEEKVEMPMPMEDERRRLPQPGVPYDDLQASPSINASIAYRSENLTENMQDVDTERRFSSSSVQRDMKEMVINDNQIDINFQEKRRDNVERQMLLPSVGFADSRRMSFDDKSRWERRNSGFENRSQRSSVTSFNDQSFAADNLIASSMLRRNSLARRSLSENNLISAFNDDLQPPARTGFSPMPVTDGSQNNSTWSRKIMRSYRLNGDGGEQRRAASIGATNWRRSSRRLSSIRRFSSQELLLDRNSDGSMSMQGFNDPQLQEEQARNRERRTRMPTVNLGLTERRKSVSRYSTGSNLGESDSGISEYDPSFMFDRSQEDTVTQNRASRKLSRSRQPRRRSRRLSATGNVLDLPRQYEMQPRRVSRAFIRDAYVSDSNV